MNTNPVRVEVIEYFIINTVLKYEPVEIKNRFDAAGVALHDFLDTNLRRVLTLFQSVNPSVFEVFVLNFWRYLVNKYAGQH